MLREIGLGTVILIVLTAVVVLLAINQTADVSFSASGVTDDVALSWGENAAMAGDAAENVVDEDGEADSEATAEATQETSE